jgi:pre-mRNA-splicing factor CWC22
VLDAIPWNVMEIFVITEATTTSASRIFIKIIFQELAEHMGMKKLFERLHEPALQTSLAVCFSFY